MAFGFLKKIGKGLGKIAQVGLPIAGSVLGGPLGGAIGGGISGALSGKGVKGIASGAALGGLGGAALKGAGGPGGLLAKIGKDPGKALQVGLAGLSTIQGAQQQAKAGQVQDQILQQAQQDQAARNALRQQALAKIGGIPQAPNLSALYAGSSNPFAR